MPAQGKVSHASWLAPWAYPEPERSLERRPVAVMLSEVSYPGQSPSPLLGAAPTRQQVAPGRGGGGEGAAVKAE